VVGASTGGPKAVETVLHDIGTSIDVPILVVQHMPEGFTRAFAERLDRHLPLRVREAEDGMVLRGGGAVIAPAGRHLRVRRDQGQVVLSLHEEPAAVAHRPSVDVLFRSAAEQFGARAVGILLTGMGSDGALGMGRLAQAGAHTIAQDEASCVVWGMPRAAAELGAAREVVALDQIGSRVRELATAAAPPGRRQNEE